MKMSPSHLFCIIAAVFVAILIYTYFIPLALVGLGIYFLPKMLEVKKPDAGSQ